MKPYIYIVIFIAVMVVIVSPFLLTGCGGGGQTNCPECEYEAQVSGEQESTKSK